MNDQDDEKKIIEEERSQSETENQSKVDENINKIEMEFVPYPNLAEIYLFKNIGPNSWIRIIESIKKIVF